jgi:hypothetical protein
MAFRVKSLLTPFFKIAHPDVLRSAPEHIQKSNSIALASLNSYIDSVNSGQSVPLSSLRFYVPSGGSSYKECKVPLLPLKQDSSESVRSFHMESLVNSINLAITSPDSQESDPKIKDPSSRPRSKNELWSSFKSGLLQYEKFKFSQENLQSINLKVERNLQRNISGLQPSDFGLKERKSDSLIRKAVETSVSSTLHKSLESTFGNLERLFIDNDLNEKQVNLGLFYLAGKNLNFQDRVELGTFFKKIRENGFGLVISSRYSAFNVPGALQVPFKFDIRGITEFYKENQEVVKERLRDMYYFKQKTEDLLKFISQTIAPCTLGRYMYQNNENYEKQLFSQSFTAAKKLKDLIETRKITKGLETKSIVIGNDFKTEEKIVEIPTVFGETQLISFLKGIKKPEKSPVN